MLKGINNKGQPPNLNKNILKIALISLFFVLLVLWIGSMMQIGANRVVESELPPDLPPIYPSESFSDSYMSVKLYFRFADENFLAAQTRQVEVRADERAETAVLRELIKGPAAGSPELEGIIHPQTSVVKVEEAGDTLFVTLSPDYLRQAEALPDEWADDVALREEAFVRKRLATWSIINALTGMGKYANVQVLIDTDGSKTGKRVSWGQMGFDDVKTPGAPIDPLSYEDSVVLSPSNTAKQALQSMVERDFTRLYRYTAAADLPGTARPSRDKFEQELSELGRIDDFRVIGSTISADGRNSLVRANVLYRDGDGSTAQRTSLPIQLIAENEIWKVTYDSLKRVLTY